MVETTLVLTGTRTVGITAFTLAGAGSKVGSFLLLPVVFEVGVVVTMGSLGGAGSRAGSGRDLTWVVTVHAE